MSVEKKDLPQPANITITISETDQDPGGYMYDVYLGTPEDIAEGDIESIDGGHCTSFDIDDVMTMVPDAVFATVRYFQETLNKK